MSPTSPSSPRPRLTTEIQERILDHLWDEPYHLRSCRLTCRAWNLWCSHHFFHFLRVNQTQDIKGLTTLLLTTDSITPLIRGLLSSREGQHNSFAHLIPHFLAPKAPRLHHLEMITSWDYQNPTDTSYRHFPLHPSIYMHFAHFRTVTRFILTEYHFPSFTDIRRLVGALPVLSRLELTRVTWERRGHPFKPLIRSTKWGVGHVTLRACTSDSVAFSFWVAPSDQDTCGASYVGMQNPCAHPCFTPSEASALTELVDLHTSYVETPSSGGYSSFVQGISYEWSQSSESSWTVTCGQDTVTGTKPFLWLTLDADMVNTRASASTPGKYVPIRVTVRSFRTIFRFGSNEVLRAFSWEGMDAPLSCLRGLQSVEFVLTLCVPDDGTQWAATQEGDREYIRERMPLVRGILLLSFYSELVPLLKAKTIRAGTWDLFRGMPAAPRGMGPDLPISAIGLPHQIISL